LKNSEEIAIYKSIDSEKTLKLAGQIAALVGVQVVKTNYDVTVKERGGTV